MRYRLHSWLFWIALVAGAYLCIDAGRSLYAFLSVDEAPILPRLPVARQESLKIPVGTPLASLSFPTLNRRFPVVEGSTKAVLRSGPGHVPGTAFPGQAGNVAIAAHRDTHFRFLRDIRVGDPIHVESPAGNTVYRVTGFRIVDPTEVSVLNPSREKRLTLITCYPFTWIGPAPKRYIVIAESTRLLRARR